jgi:hypothetical protein
VPRLAFQVIAFGVEQVQHTDPAFDFAPVLIVVIESVTIPRRRCA